jgi:hypothetical protein
MLITGLCFESLDEIENGVKDRRITARSGKLGRVLFWGKEEAYIRKSFMLLAQNSRVSSDN